MNDAQILLPALALAWWTMLIVGLIPYRRFSSFYKGEVTGQDFEFGESERVPANVLLANRNYMNLLEVPIIFYLVCVTYYAIGGVGSAALILAWVYVALRVSHSIVHVSYNNVVHRLYLFGTSNLILVLFLLTLTYSILRVLGINA